MRATDSLALAVPLALALLAGRAHAQDAPPPEPPPLLGAGIAMPVSTDPGMMPPIVPAKLPRPILEVHGFAATWLTPVTDKAAPQHATDTFRMRWAVLRVDAHPVPHVHVLTRLGLMVDPTLLDLSMSFTKLPALNVTVGQFRQPFGAAATTLAPQLVMVDRPTYVYAMTKATFRDVGLMLGTGEQGLFGGLMHYRLSATAGTGRVLAATPTLADDVRAPLYTARVLADFGKLVLGPRDRLALGATLAYTRDPAIDGKVPATARAIAANALGRLWTTTTHERDTLLLGADATLSAGSIWAQAEWMYLASRATDDHSVRRRAVGTSLELAYTLPVALGDTKLQLATRAELADPDLSVNGDGYAILAGGINLFPEPFVRVSFFAQATAYDRPMNAGSTVGAEATVRLALVY